MSSKNYNILIGKLQEFIRKYYKNRLIRGSIYFFSTFLAFFLLATTLESIGHFGSAIRTTLFYGLILVTAAILTKWILLPLIRLMGLGSTISRDQAARIIGAHFPEVKDRLLNTLQLYDRAEKESSGNAELIRASIDQRIEGLKPVPFAHAIDLRKNRRYLKYAVPPLLVLLVIVFTAPTVITDGTARLVKHREPFEPSLPFNFEIVNDKLSVIEQNDFPLELQMRGKVRPDKVYVNIGEHRFRMEKTGNGTFKHVFKNVKESIDFHFTASGYDSRSFQLKTLPDPTILNFDVALDYPDYLGKSDKTLKNTGDLVIPGGTTVQWVFRTQHTEELRMAFPDSAYQLKPRGKDRFTFERKVLNSQDYTIRSSNQYIDKKKAINYQIEVKPDRHPSIAVEEKVDSMTQKRRYFQGEVEDDHGLSRLVFHYELLQSDSSEQVEIPVESGARRDRFFHDWNLGSLGIGAGEGIRYYFEVWDNDQVNGSKSTRSKVMTYNAPTQEEIQERTRKRNEKIRENLSESVREARKLKKEVRKIREDLLSKNSLSWEDKKRVKELLKREEALRERIEKARELNRKKNREKAEFTKQDEEMKEKAERVQEMLDKVMSDEMKKQMEKLRKELDKMNKRELQKEMSKMEEENENVEKEMDRNLEVFKQLNFKTKMKNTIRELEKLAKKQEKLAQKTEEAAEEKEGKDKGQPSDKKKNDPGGKKKRDQEGKKDAGDEKGQKGSRKKKGEKGSLEQEQKKLNEDFNELEKELKELEEMNKKLQFPHDMKDTEREEQAIDKAMEKSREKLQKQEKKKATGHQKNASEKLDKLGKKMAKMQQGMEKEAVRENLEDLRTLLENVVQLSVDQEDLMNRLEGTSPKSAEYVDMGQEQRELKDGIEKVEDSLYALSKRVDALKSKINRKVRSINDNLDKAISFIGERKTGKATSRQQYVMTNLNDVALLLDEALQSMMRNMAMKMGGKGNCQKPGGKGGSKPSLSEMRKMQEQLKKNMKKLKKQMENGKNPGGKKKGGKQKGGKGGLSEKLAKMAAKQAAIRQKLQEKAQELNEKGKGQGNDLQKIAEEMEKNEEDIVNKRLTREMLKRQERITTRLLESEKAERKRKFSKERKAEQAKKERVSDPESFFEYKKKAEKEVELLRTVPPALRSYYKDRVNRYFKEVQ